MYLSASLTRAFEEGYSGNGTVGSSGNSNSTINSSGHSSSFSVVAGIAAAAVSAVSGGGSGDGGDGGGGLQDPESSPYGGLMPLVNFHLNHSFAEASVLTGTGPAASTSSNTLFLVLVSVTLVGLILTTIIGNVFVISAIILERALRTVGNYLVLSLAVTDLLVACLVMPIGALYEVTQEWNLGTRLCEMWTFVDVLCCTASIFHLLAIACDRFWAVTTVDYIHRRKAKHVCLGILLIWLFSGVISLGPMLGWKDADFEERIIHQKLCLVSQAMSYQVFATVFSFYAPSALLCFLYYRIFKVAQSRLLLKKQRYKYRIRRRPSFYRPRKSMESEIICRQELPSACLTTSSISGHRASFNPADDYFSSSAIPGTSSSGVYSSASTTGTDFTTATMLSETSPNSLSPLAIVINGGGGGGADGAGAEGGKGVGNNGVGNGEYAAISQATLQGKRLSIAQFLAFQQQKQSDMCEQYVRCASSSSTTASDQSAKESATTESTTTNNNRRMSDFQRRSSLHHFTHHNHNHHHHHHHHQHQHPRRDSFIVNLPECPTSNIVVYVDDFASYDGETVADACSSGKEFTEEEYEEELDEEMEEEDEEEDDEEEEEGDTNVGVTIDFPTVFPIERLQEEDEEEEEEETGKVPTAVIAPNESRSRKSSSATAPAETQAEKMINCPSLSPSPSANGVTVNGKGGAQVVVSLSPVKSTTTASPPSLVITTATPNTFNHRRTSSTRRSVKHHSPSGQRGVSKTADSNKSMKKKKKLQFRSKITRYDSNESKQESKAAKTLTIITGIFLICWLPFFTCVLYMSFCKDCVINKYVFDFLLWLGWSNSAFNPLLYTIFSPDFKNAFKRLYSKLFGQKKKLKRRTTK
ncbi:G-protein coupled receptor [Tyrophagus putrescentiae]|nr:G-protein coupled receptor [Tyrophagus putrescentiae]